MLGLRASILIVIPLSFVLNGAPLPAAPPVTAIAVAHGAPDREQSQIVVGSQAGIEVREWPALDLVRTIPTSLEQVHDLSFSPDGKTLLAAGGAPSEAGEVEVYAWPTGRLLRRVTGHTDVVYRVAWRGDGRSWATASGDGTCHVVNPETGERTAVYEGHSRAVLAICILPDGASVLSAGADQTLQLWRADSGERIRTLDNHVSAVNDVALRPTPMTDSASVPVVASASDDRTVRLWQPTLGRLMRFKRLVAAPRALAWSADGRRLLVGCQDGRLRVLDPDDLGVTFERAIFTGWIHALATMGREDQAVAGGEGGAVHLSPVR